MMFRLLFKSLRPAQLFVALIGALTGMLLLLFSVQLYVDISATMKNESDALGNQFLVINKEVSVLNSLALSSSGFQAGDIEDLKKLPEIKDVGAFTAATFSVKAFIEQGGSGGFPALYTDLFFESVPERFLDVSASLMRWEEGDEDVPIIVPTDYINLYNFGFAPSQGLPQLSKGTVSLARFNLRIAGQGKEVVMKAKIAGFSNRINTILVPHAFMQFANARYGSNENKAPSRLILNAKDISSPSLAEYLEEHGYETNAEQMKNGKINTLLRIVIGVCLSVGLLIILLSIVGFIQYAQLLLNKSTYEISTLIKLGFEHSFIWKKYMRFYGWIMAVILVICLVVLYVGKGMLFSFMKEKGIDIPEGISFTALNFAVLAMVSMTGIQALVLWKDIKSLAMFKRNF